MDIFGNRKVLWVLAALLPGPVSAAAEYNHLGHSNEPPIMLSHSGGFPIGGVIKAITLNPFRPNGTIPFGPNGTNPFGPGLNITNPVRPNITNTLSCDHGYMEYFIPSNARQTSLVMWHSSSTQVWQNRWDGGPGFKDMFLRRGYPVYLWDGPRVGRANWGCETYTYVPSARDQGNFASWSFGPRYGVWWDDVQFPAGEKREEIWEAATRARYQEFDTYDNVQLHARAASVAADSGRVGESIVYLTNSAAGLRAQLTVTKSNTTNIKGIVAYESIGFVFPENMNITRPNRGGFGPITVPLEDFKKLARVKGIQFVWGDHRCKNDTYVQQSRRCAALINAYGGNAKVLMLAEDAGLKGSTHIPVADMDNDKVAALLDDFLTENQLDGRE